MEDEQEDGFIVREVNNNHTPIQSENLTVGISIEQLLKKYSITQIDFLKAQKFVDICSTKKLKICLIKTV